MNFKELAPVLVRWGLALVLIWFGFAQVLTPEWFYQYVQAFGDVSEIKVVVIINGIVSLLLGAGLLVGVFVRGLGLAAGVYLLIISFGLGYSDDMVRNLGLTTMAFSVFFHGKDEYCWK